MAKDAFIKDHMNRKRMADVMEVFVRAGVDTVIGDDDKASGRGSSSPLPGSAWSAKFVGWRLFFPGDVHCEVSCAMAADAALQASLRVKGREGELTVDNPIAPHIGHRLRLRTGEHEESEQVEGRTTYDHQLEAFVAAVVDGQKQPTGAQDAIANMRVIDAVYRAAGMQPRGTGGG